MKHLLLRVMLLWLPEVLISRPFLRTSRELNYFRGQNKCRWTLSSAVGVAIAHLRFEWHYFIPRMLILGKIKSFVAKRLKNVNGRWSDHRPDHRPFRIHIVRPSSDQRPDQCEPSFFDSQGPRAWWYFITLSAFGKHLNVNFSYQLKNFFNFNGMRIERNHSFTYIMFIYFL